VHAWGRFSGDYVVIDPDGLFSFHITIVNGNTIVWKMIDNFVVIIIADAVALLLQKKRSVEITRCLMNAQSISCIFWQGRRGDF
jgi:hypothetical protein